jgi:N4-gp56 family major capsid protein
MHLLADLVDDGVGGDNQREGYEEEMKTYNDTIVIDLISHGTRQKGKLAEQKSVVEFRTNAKERLAFWLANRMDQLAFLTLSGISYTLNNDGSPRSSATFANLAFSADVSAPTANRGFRWDGVNSTLVAANTAGMLATDTLTYKAIVDICVKAKTNYIKPLNVGGKEYYVAFIRPEGLAQLKKDADYQRAVVTGADRGKDNPWFTGGIMTVDGIVFHEHRLVYNTKGALSGSKWGATGTIDGSRMLICGSQALGFADLGAPEWSEKWLNFSHLAA